MSNLDRETVEGFGREWSSFDQTGLTESERLSMYRDYFRIFPWDRLPEGAVGADVGCGTGRWALLVAPRVGILHCVDPSDEALAVARSNLSALVNVRFHHAGVDALPFPDGSLDFAFALGVLHHVPDTAAGIRSVAAKLKRGGVFLVYLYYAFDNRPHWYRALWRLSHWIRLGTARLPYPLRYALSQCFAAVVYWPLARSALMLERLGRMPPNWPLAYYRDKSLYVMRTDSLDRFGTRLEQRFTQPQIARMLEESGLTQVRFSEGPPFWCAVAIRN